MIKIIPFLYQDIDDLFANTYVLIDEHNNCIIIDPSKDYDGVINYIKANKLNCKAVLLTHTHFDHMRGVDRIVKFFNIPLYVDFFDIPGLKDINTNCSSMANQPIIVSAFAESISDKQKLNLLDEEIMVMETPFHTLGSVCYYLKDSGVLISGDSLFKLSIGRADLPSSIISKKRKSLEYIFSLPDDTKVYPGHGKFTTIGDERKLNPFVKI